MLVGGQGGGGAGHVVGRARTRNQPEGIVAKKPHGPGWERAQIRGRNVSRLVDRMLTPSGKHSVNQSGQIVGGQASGYNDDHARDCTAIGSH